MMNKRKAARAYNHLHGFSLIEMAVVLVIIGLVMGGVLGALGPQLEQKKVRDTQERIKQASEAIMAFAIANRRLPCPASVDSPANSNSAASASSNGDEGRTGNKGECTHPNIGFVPARTLGLGERGTNGVMQDAWGFGIRYAVTQITSDTVTGCGGTCFPFTLTDGIKNANYLTVEPDPTKLLQVCESSTGINATACGSPANQIVRPAFVVWSTARNGAVLPAGSGADEAANLDNNMVYVTHPRTETSASNGAFDDLLQWRTAPTVFLDMIKMGILP
jgi:prepilin-type N-terminal cleavage/methylation domain-containing protein